MSLAAQTLPGVALALVAGGAGGWLFFASLRRTVDLWLSGGAATRALALHLGRFVVLGAVLAGAALAGALPLLAATAGVLLARALVLRRARS